MVTVLWMTGIIAKISFKKNDNRKINLRSSLNISSLTSEVRSKTAVSWSVTWKEPRGLKEKGGKRREGVETRLSP